MRASDLQRPAVSGELEVAAAYGASCVLRAHRAFPVHDADATARVELLVVEQRLEHPFAIAGTHAKRHRVLDAGARRAPAALRGEVDVAWREHAAASVGVKQRSAR